MIASNLLSPVSCQGSIVYYTATDLRPGRPNLEIVTEQSTGIGSLPADFWVRTLCLGKPAGLVVAAVSMYNPNTQLGRIEVRPLQPVPPSSPVATDSRALSRLCMQAPPHSSMKQLKNKKKKAKKRALELSEQGGGTRMAVDPNATDPTMLTTPSRMTMDNAAAAAVPISAEPSLKKLKKKKKLAMSVSSATDGSGVPSSIRKVQTAESTKRREDFSPNQKPEYESFSFQTKTVVPIASTKDPVREAKQSKATNTATASFAYPPQVSPSSATTPSNNDGQGGTPSSVESTKMQHGAIAKFLQPKRVLHNWPDKQQPLQQDLAPPALSLVKVASPPVPLKVRKSSDESQSSNPKEISAGKAERRSSNESFGSSKSRGSRGKITLADKTPESALGVHPARLKFQSQSSNPKEISAGKAERRSSNESFGSSKSKGSRGKNTLAVKTPESALVVHPARLEFRVKKTIKIQVPSKATTETSSAFPKDSAPAPAPADSNSEQATIGLKKRRDVSSDKTCGLKTTPTSNNKRPREESSEDNYLANVANMLVDLKAPPGVGKARSKSPRPVGHSPAPSLTRDEKIISQAKKRFRKLQAHIDSLPKTRSRLLTQSANRFGSFPPQSRRAQVLQEHRAAQETIQKRLLRSAESTLQSLVDSHISIEGARAELKNSIRSFEEVLVRFVTLSLSGVSSFVQTRKLTVHARVIFSLQHDTLKRQELELEAVVDDKRHQVPNPPSWSFRSAFDKVEEIHQSLEPPKRAPGRPKAS